MPKYGKLEIAIRSDELKPDNTYQVYDSSSVDMYAIFTAPSGKKYRRNAFWMVQYSRCNTCPNPVEYPLSDPRYCSDGWADVAEIDDPNDPNIYMSAVNTPYNWRVRFAPPETGSWSYKVYAKAGANSDSSASYSFTVTSSADKGYIGRTGQHRYFVYKESGEIFIPLGLNSVKNSAHDTIHNRVAMSYATELMTQMTPHGGNLLRIMMTPFNFGIEWRSRLGPGNYGERQKQATDLDSVLSLAEQLGVYLHFVYDHQDALSHWWTDHAYHVNNPGGFLTNVDSFFTNAQSRMFYKRKIRYILARWGYSPHLFCLEPLQEIEGYGGNYWHWPQNIAVRDWYREMIQYGKTIDTNHMYAASTQSARAGAKHGQDGINHIPELDIVNDHFYGSDYNLNFQLNHLAQFNKARYPHKAWYFGELGIKWHGLSWMGSGNYVGSPSNPIYNNASEWHNPLWSTMMSGGAAPGLHWSENITNVLRPPTTVTNCWGGQYRYFEPLSRFIENDTIFIENPLPIANSCQGRGEKDAMWYHSSLYAFDTTNNKCACYPREHLYMDDSLIDNNYVSSGITTTNDSLIEVFALKTNTRAIGWIHHKQNYWYRLPHNAGGDNTSAVAAILAHINDLGPDTTNITTFFNDSLTIESLTAGMYRLDFYSTYPQYEVNANNPGLEDGGIIPAFTDTINADCNGQIRFRIPTLRPLTTTSAPFAPDYGFKLTWISPVTVTNITANTTWSASSYITGDVTVNNGATLTISGSGTIIRMPKNGKITVKTGGYLYINGATITSDCDSMWQGIIVSGQSNQHQTATNQGKVQVTGGAVLEHAYCAISYDSLTKTGGIITAINSIFRNNKTSIQLHHYRNFLSNAPKGNVSYINNCTFEIDNNYRGEAINQPFSSHLAMYAVEGIPITGCRFYNRSSLGKRGYGIFSLNAGYNIAPYCTIPSTGTCTGTLIKNEFKGFLCGILAECDGNGYLETITVNDAQFDSNSIGVRTNNVQDIAILKSRFYVGNGIETEIHDCYQNAGTFTTGSNRFRIEENEYVGYVHGGQASGWINMGAITENSGPHNNEIYKNTFTDLTYGAHAWKNNSDKPSAPFWQAPNGLRYYCNAFTDNKIDIAISATYPEGIAGLQGDGTLNAQNVILGAGNTWTSSSYSNFLHNISNTGHAVTFAYRGTAPTGMAWNNTTSNPTNINFVQASPERECPSKITTGITQLGGTAQTALNTLRSELPGTIINMRDAYDALIDGGSTGALLTELSTLPGLDAHERLMEIAPYVSETALRYAIDNTIMSQGLLTEVLQANPDVLRNGGFILYLDDAGFDLQDFEAALTEPTERTGREAELVRARNDLAEAYRLLIADLKGDTTYENISLLPGLFTDQGTLAATYELAHYYYSIGNDVAGAELLEDVPDLFTLSSEEETIHTAHNDIREILQYMKEYQARVLTSDQEEVLDEIAGEHSNHPVGVIANVMLYNYGTKMRLICAPAISPEFRKSPTTMKVKKATKVVDVYPNPAKDHVVFSYNLQNVGEGLKLIITDISGKPIKEIRLEHSKGITHWYTNDLPNGIYLYKLSDNKKQHGNGKVVIVK
ncbi:MAG TPA: T9SS type A sorting domain-containing protein [Flavipsychrobacter sp.]|nr:T9SS type A sorting domain-containing protein [Flavipsychrobacter sp.]